MWNDSIKLPTGIIETRDKDGFQTEQATFLTNIPANFKDAKRADETLAEAKGYTADLVIEIMKCNYQNQSYLVDESNLQEYEIKRTHAGCDKELLELICQRR